MSQPNPSDTTDTTDTTGAGMRRTDPTAPTERGTMGGTWRRTARVVGGVVLVLLGLLWVLQGADVVRIRPILCVADCRPLTGGSTAWLAVGVVTVVVGLCVVGVRRRRRG